jgi:Flp pilus assembly protein TadG
VKGERGTASLELALVAPVLMLLVLGVLQFGLLYHARQVVQGAALEGARVSAAEDGSAAAGRARAIEILREGLGSAATEEAASASVSPDVAQVRATARFRGLLPIPGLSSFLISSEATAYRERFRRAGDGP